MSHSLMRKLFAALLSATLAVTPLTPAHAAAARIKDIVDFEGVRENQLVGYGLVVGLNGTGDSLNNSPFTKQSLQSMLERLGVNSSVALSSAANSFRPSDLLIVIPVIRSTIPMAAHSTAILRKPCQLGWLD